MKSGTLKFIRKLLLFEKIKTIKIILNMILAFVLLNVLLAFS
jgi:hypothetical protein